MKKFLIIGLLALTSCAQIQSFQNEVKARVQTVFTPDTFDSVTILMGTAESAGYSYRDLCERKIIRKSCWQTIATLQPLENKAYISYKALKDFVKSNPTSDASAFIAAAKDAIVALRTMQTKNGVN